MGLVTLRRTALLASAAACLCIQGNSAPAAAAVRPVATSVSGGLVTWSGLANPAVVDTASGLYFAWQTSANRPGSAVYDELARVDRTTGRIETERPLRATFDSAVSARGSLFVATTASTGVTLYRLGARSLATLGHWHVADGSGHLGPGFGSVAVVGDSVWVSGRDRLLRISLRDDRAAASRVLAGTVISYLASNASGTALILGTADAQGAGAIEERNPVSGELIATSPPMDGVTAPRVGGAIGGAVWFAEPTGMMGYVDRVPLAGLATMQPACVDPPSATCIPGSNDIGAVVKDGVLWVSQVAGGTSRNFCGDPITGQALAALPIPANDYLLAVGSRVVYVAQTGTVVEVPIPSACRG